MIDIQTLSHSQRDRLAHIDLRLRLLGDITRQDIVQRFGIQSAAATRDLGAYKSAAPGNIEYDAKTRRYIASAAFRPLFHTPPAKALVWLSQGYGDGGESAQWPSIPCETPSLAAVPDLDALAGVTRAIHSGRAIKISYLSVSSGKTTREIVPFALFDGGQRWYVRAFDRKTREFRDFAISRIERVSDARASDPVAEEGRDRDDQWARIVELELVPHPDRPRPEITMRDYAMSDGSLRIRLRAAVAGYALRRWEVDCSPDHSLSDPGHRLWLKDHLALYGVRNAVLAHGYRPIAEARP